MLMGFRLGELHTHVVTSWEDGIQPEVTISYCFDEARNSIFWKAVNRSFTIQNIRKFLAYSRRIWRETRSICLVIWNNCVRFCNRLPAWSAHGRYNAYRSSMCLLCLQSCWIKPQGASNWKDDAECKTWKIYRRADEFNQVSNCFWERGACTQQIWRNCCWNKRYMQKDWC